jgi:REP element-mobilizing transposase RayT
VDRYWLLTWTTYGTWLPGDDRGFVSNVRDGDGPELRHNTPGTTPDAKVRGLVIDSRERMLGPTVYLNAVQAGFVLEQLHETARYRGWELAAVAVMANHLHLVVGVPDDPEPDTLLRDFKSYASRRLNAVFAKPASGTWWTQSGSRRKLPNDTAVRAAVEYVKRQHSPLLVWASGRRQLADSEPAQESAG